TRTGPGAGTAAREDRAALAIQAMEPENTAGSARRRDGGCQSGDPCLLWGKSPRPRTRTGEKGPFPAAERQARGANEPAKTNNTPSQEPAQFLSLHSCLGG